MPKGEKLIGQSKRTAPPPYFLKTFFFQIRTIAFAKTLLITKGRTFQGSFYLVKGKAFEKWGEYFKTYKCLWKLNSYAMANCKRI
jgi:hypothetical protein